MNGKHESLIGNKYGMLKVIGIAEKRQRSNGSHNVMWKCECICGREKDIATSNLTRTTNPTRSCGICQRAATFGKMVGSANPAWKGGRFVDTEGYVQVWAPNHPNAKKIGYIREHRLIMSQLLNRPLILGENVHHKNGNRQDNTPENLELWNTSQPAGQRVEDKIKWAKEILKLYEK